MLLTSDATSPYAFTWSNVTSGSYTVYAIARDNGGATRTSSAITVSVGSGAPAVLLADDFNDNSLDTTKWDTADLFTGTENPSIPLTESNYRLSVGPLLAGTAGTNYYGVDSLIAYDFAGGSAHVELVQAPSAGAVAYAMFTVGANQSNYYRLFVSGNTLTAQRRIANVKDDLVVGYVAADHRYLRIRHDATTGEVLWEAAPAVAAGPGTWTVIRREAWDTTAVPLSSILFELKAGTSDAQPAPGTVVFDNFKAYRQGASTENVIYAADIAAAFGSWRHVADPSAADGVKLAVADAGLVTASPLAAPASYFDVPFTADAGTRYRVWLRLRAAANNVGNDSVWVQFSNALNQVGQAAYRIGTTDALRIDLENCSGCGVSGWGWQNSSYDLSATGEVWFSTSGSQTLRVQVREDGVEIDQIVISAASYVDTSPGPSIADATLVTRVSTNETPEVALSSPQSGAAFAAPASIAITATAFDPDGSVARVDFYANGTLVGSDTSAPYAYTWGGVPGGSHAITAVAVDNVGAATSTTARTVTVNAVTGGGGTLLADDFSAAAIDGSKWDSVDLFSGTESSAVVVTQSSGQLRLALPDNLAGTHYRGVDTQQTYDFTGAAASVELAQPPSSAVVAYAMFTVGVDVNNYYRLFVSGTSLVAQRRMAGLKNDVTFAYDGAAHRFLRIRHDATSGQVLWETAPSVGGVPGTWTVRRQEPWDTGLVPLGTVRVELKAGTSDPQASPGTVVFDNFLLAQGGSAETVVFTEDFSAASLDSAKWAVSVQSGAQDPAISVTQASGRLSIGPLLSGTAGSHYNGILSQTAFDVTNAAVSVEAVSGPASSTTADMMFTLTVDGAHHYRIFLEQGALKFERRTTAYGKQSVGADLAFDSTTHAFWRIRHEESTDQLVYETAPRVGGAPGTWVERGRTWRATLLTGVKVELKAGTWQAEATAPGTVQFDSVKVAR